MKETTYWYVEKDKSWNLAAAIWYVKKDMLLKVKKQLIEEGWNKMWYVEG